MTKYPTIDSELTQETFSFPFVIGITARQWVEPHHHQFYEISFYAQGSALDLVNGQMIKSSRGTVVCKLPHRIHETKLVKGQTYTKFNLMFDMDILLESEIDAGLKHFFYFSADNEKSPFFQLDNEQTVLMERLFHEIFKDFKADDPFRHSYIRSKLIEILVQISRSQGRIENTAPVEAPADSTNTGLNNNKISLVLQFINRHFLTEVSLGSLSQKFNVSTPYLSKMIKKVTGMNFTDYLHELRIEMACSLLISTRMNILNVSEEAGYSSFKTFSRVFLKKKGVSPSKYRLQFAKIKY
ncbi:AraC family transcriptional regulator [Paenibacillus eucommiae]|uniref:YesN/AraC family two-component response regulator n=1 Tax=Paenibacillus eucommiae TaxID=1355755 RepID=A0ABS4IZT2_9BACL|nr:AraC family transcriptional regulator [Paenibacillus eucommiae]MBP1992506.1 YesN/AraC family two-component response regulator [Paenibacillus eucommiae]